MTGVVLRQPRHTHRERAVAVDPYGGWIATCTCGDEFAGTDERKARRALSGHVGVMEARFRAWRVSLVSKAEEVDC